MSAAEKLSTEYLSHPSTLQASASPTPNSQIPASAEKRRSDYLSGLEQQMKQLWSQYIKCLDKDGLSERAKDLRDKYFRLYRCYRHNREWRKMINNNN